MILLVNQFKKVNKFSIVLLCPIILAKTHGWNHLIRKTEDLTK